MISRREWRNRALLVAAAVLFALLAMELGCRLLRGPWFLVYWPNLVLLEADQHRKPCMFVHDDKLGYVPEPDCKGPEHSHDAQGLRLMPPAPADTPDRPLLLAVGDSYTYSDEVKNDETWPAYLQGMLHRRIANGGVPGYGLDQSILRGEQLAAKLHPDVMLLGFIADDLQRDEMGRLYGSEKPYFDIADGKLVLRHEPAFDKPVSWATLPFWQRWFGWSMLVDKYMRHFGHYSQWFWQDEQALPAGSGERLACLMMQRVAAIGVPTLVVAQYRPHLWTEDKEWAAEQRRLSQVVLRCAEAAGLQTYDSYSLIDDAVRAQGVKALYGGWHHSALGNHLVAEGVSAELTRRRMLP
ncbi:MAG: hypothetical protein JSR24_05440 [Proteobacteria bacterium]|nr:hypothetical protein [Pseudomonadota bacterium]